MPKEVKQEKEEALEKKLWKAADKLRKNMDAAEYKHVVLGLIFPIWRKYAALLCGKRTCAFETNAHRFR